MLDLFKKSSGIVFFLFSLGFSQLLSGSATLKLNGPASAEQSNICKNNARKELKQNLIAWLSENHGITIDSLNPLDNFAIEKYIDSCFAFIKEETAFQGKILSVTLLLDFESAEKALQNHNNAFDTRAAESWKKFNAAKEANDFQQMYYEGIRTLAAANAHFGPPLILPESNGEPLSKVARTAVQQYFDRMRVTSTQMVLEGRPGHIVNQAPLITIMIDSTPISGVWFTCKYQTGKEIFTKITDETGGIKLNEFVIPFVTNGTLVYLSIDPGKIIGSPTLIDSKHFGINLKNSQEQTFIIKINRSLYTLDYKATSVGNIKLPPDFAANTAVVKFLRDSCYMQEAGRESPSDLKITIQTQVSDYEYDETEDTGIKTSINVAIEGLTMNPPVKKEHTLIFEKKYEQKTAIPYGLYFWEANTKIREAIKTTLSLF
jgi:hypothetical protein